MKIIRAPLRVSLFGGGTDLDPFCSEYGSTIISFAIDRYIYLTWNPRPTGGCHLGYSEVEELETLKDAKHTLVRVAAQAWDIPEPCTMTIISDMPKGTGLGSSSALAVALAEYRAPGCDEDLLILSAEAIEAIHSNAGWQDYLPAVFGGFNRYRISGNSRSFALERARISRHTTDVINGYGMLFYTNQSRPADSVLPSWQKSEERLHEIKALADEVSAQIDDITPERLGKYLDQTWQMKRAIPGVTSPDLNRQYAVAMLNGALGGKLCGAGAGGCWFFLVPPISTTRARVRAALNLPEIPFKIAEKGVQSWEL